MKKTLVMAAAAVLTGSMAYPSLAEEYVFEMAPVVVTANRMNENLVDARADISVVTSRQIEKLHLNTVEDALRTVPDRWLSAATAILTEAGAMWQSVPAQRRI